MDSFSQTAACSGRSRLPDSIPCSALHNNRQQHCCIAQNRCDFRQIGGFAQGFFNLLATLAAYRYSRTCSSFRRHKKVFVNRALARIATRTANPVGKNLVDRLRAGNDHWGLGTISPHEPVIKSETGTGISCFVNTWLPRTRERSPFSEGRPSLRRPQIGRAHV